MRFENTLLMLICIIEAAFATTQLRQPNENQVTEPLNVYPLLDNTFELSHMRIHTLDDSTEFGAGTNWQQTSFPNLLSDNSSYIRGVIEAPTTKSYAFTFDYRSEAYPLCVYVNEETVQTFSLPSTSWAEGTNTISLTLQVGDNVVIFQVNNWGGIKSIAMDSSLTLISDTHDPSTDGVYRSIGDGWLNDTVLAGYDGDIHSPAATMIPKPFVNDANASFNGYVTFSLLPFAGAKSIDINYYQTAYQGAGNNGLVFSVNGGADQFFELTATDVNTMLHQNIDPDVLGLDITKSNTVVVKTNTTNSAKVGLISLSYSSVDPDSGNVDPLEYDVYDGDSLRALTNLRGRSYQGSGNIVIDWSGSGIEFSLTGASTVKMDFVSTGGKIAYDVDGEVKRATVSTGTSLVVAAGLDKTMSHTMKIYKDNEAAGALCELESMEVEKGGTVSKLPEKTSKLEFVGASITCGNQIDHNGAISAYGAFPRLVADAFDADFHSVCVSGRGLMEGYNSEETWAPSQTNQLKDIYWQNSHFRNASFLYDTTLYQPDVLIANIGDNDLGESIMSTFSTTISDYIEALKAFHAQLRMAYPNTEIIYMYGTYYNRDFNDEYREAVDDFKAFDPKTDYIYMPFYSGGKDGHPSYKQHQEIASRLEALICQDTSLETTETISPLSIRYEAEKASILGTTSGIKTGSNSFSEWSYVGEMGPSSNINITDPSQILADGTDVKILTETVKIPDGSAGYYDFVMGYSTSVTGVGVYVKVDEGAWQFLSLPSTEGWGTVYESDALSLKLSEGTHTITWTGALVSNKWVNFDYFELTFSSTAVYYSIGYPTSSAYSFLSAPLSVEEGGTLRFRVSLAAAYSKSALTVKANGASMALDDDGFYSLTGVSENVAITVEGVSLNRWFLTFKDNDGTVYSSQEYEVGTTIDPIEDPIKEGYVFEGWDKTVPSSMPNGNLILTAIWSEETVTPNSNGKTATIGWIVGGCIGTAVLLAGGIGFSVFSIKKKRK